MATDETVQTTETTQETKDIKPTLNEITWGDDFKKEDLTIPYKNEQPEQAEIEEEVEEEPEITEEYTEPEPVVTTQDPGTYTPQDYSFEMTLNNKTTKIHSQEESEKYAEENAEELTPAQIMRLMSKTTDMVLKEERDKKEFEDKKTLFDSQNQVEKARQETVSSMASEFEYLVGKGLLPAVAAEYKDADWGDPEVAKQPGVKEQLALLDYIVKENTVRAKSGVKPFSSVIDAHNSFVMDKGRKQTEKAREAAGEARKAAGSKVAGTTTNPIGASSAPKGIAVGRPNAFRSNQAQWEN